MRRIAVAMQNGAVLSAQFVAVAGFDCRTSREPRVL
jgi:hypothetical protein